MPERKEWSRTMERDFYVDYCLERERERLSWLTVGIFP
jgi:hypothetical protein